MAEPTNLEALDQTALTRLMSLALAGPRRPVDALIQRLGASDGTEWLDRILQEDLPERERELIERATTRDASIDELRELKDLSKESLSAAKTENDRVCALFAYFTAIAGALVIHDEVITSRTPADLEPVLLDLAEALPAPHQDLVSEAGMRAAERAGA